MDGPHSMSFDNSIHDFQESRERRHFEESRIKNQTQSARQAAENGLLEFEKQTLKYLTDSRIPAKPSERLNIPASLRGDPARIDLPSRWELSHWLYLTVDGKFCTQWTTLGWTSVKRGWMSRTKVHYNQVRPIAFEWQLPDRESTSNSSYYQKLGEYSSLSAIQPRFPSFGLVGHDNSLPDGTIVLVGDGSSTFETYLTYSVIRLMENHGL